MISINPISVAGKTATKLRLMLVGYAFGTSYTIHYTFFTSANEIITAGNLSYSGSHIASGTRTSLQNALTAAVGSHSNGRLVIWKLGSQTYKFFSSAGPTIVQGSYISSSESNALKSLALTDLGVTEASGLGAGQVLAAENVAYTWFGRPTNAYNAGKAWIGVTKDIVGGTFQHIVEYNESTEAFSATQVGTVSEKDDHNQPSILVRSSDSRLLIAYTEHSGAVIRLRISTNPNSAAAWGAEFTIAPDGTGGGKEYCYAHLYQLANGNIILFYRLWTGTTAQWRYVKSTDGGSTWGASVEVYSPTTQGYVITCQSDTDPNIIHCIASDKHPAHNSFSPTSVYHFYFNAHANTFHQSNGTALTAPLIPSELTALSPQVSPDSAWIDDITCSGGNPRVLFTHYPNGVNTSLMTKDLYYKEWTGSAWTASHKIATSLVGYIEEDAGIQEFGYVPNARFDYSNKSIIWAAIEVSNITEIHKVVRNSSSSFTITQITSGSTVNNWRPISLPTATNNVLWLRNNVYRMYTDYDMDLIAITQ